MPDTYVFEAHPGMAYILEGPNQNIVLLDRFQKSASGFLHPVARHEFVTDQELATSRQNELTAAANAGVATVEQR
ncbi:hypothetical protein, partial [Pseudomonas sp.]|uniref:hypothetical protein n=1 Tax=Pseudomonas sp. TaxID=306 RepID=UPI002620E882